MVENSWWIRNRSRNNNSSPDFKSDTRDIKTAQDIYKVLGPIFKKTIMVTDLTIGLENNC